MKYDCFNIACNIGGSNFLYDYGIQRRLIGSHLLIAGCCSVVFNISVGFLLRQNMGNAYKIVTDIDIYS